jgi:eukaryotic-like serine/threonine-protein kinase
MPSAPRPSVADRYTLIEPLGEGGMGRVWLARDEVLHRDVAVKEIVPPPGLSSTERDQANVRSLREARAIARLTHPNVVRIYDVVPKEPWPWIVMEYVPAQSLQQHINQDGPVPALEAARIGLGILGALQAAHRAGVLHRDVKPGNVLLAPDRVVLTDFGLATMEGDATITRSGMILGSPAYISPERAREGTSGPEADLWSLGATLYAAVEGQAPYQRTTAIATLTALATEEPDPAAHAGPLRPVLDGLLRKDPAERMPAPEAERLLRRVVARARPAPGTLATRVPRPRPAEPTVLLDPPAPPPAEPTTALPSAAPAAEGAEVEPTGPVVSVRILVIGTVILLVLLAAAVGAGLALRQHHKPAAVPPPSHPAASSGAPSAAGTPSGTASRTSTSITSLPGGWHAYHDPTGFTVAVPDGWAQSRSGTIVYFKEPGGGRVLGIDQSDQPKSDPVADWTQQAQYRVGHGDFPGYQQIKIVRVDYHVAAADWEFTYRDHGVPTHVINRGAVFGPHQAYGIYWSTPESQWSANLSNFDLIMSTFQGLTG